MELFFVPVISILSVRQDKSCLHESPKIVRKDSQMMTPGQYENHTYALDQNTVMLMP